MAEYVKKSSIIGLAHKMQFGRILTDREAEVVEMVVNSVHDEARVDLVRCRECKHREEEVGKLFWCERVQDFISNQEWFCADGKRKGGADDEND
jgi:hypothetical protein